MKTLLILSLLVLTPFVSFAEDIKVCSGEDIMDLTITATTLDVTIKGTLQHFVILNQMSDSGEIAKEDRDLIGEEVSISTVYQLRDSQNEEIYLAKIVGVSGAIYIVQVNPTHVLGNTSVCQ